ncbi:MAG: hypothetical protein JXA20_06415, partial [Spirochaetes bacterium]|nr:hypothetical protein [Spirochaetota bacterium]
MSDQHKGALIKFLILQGAIGIAINLSLNAGIGIYMVRGVDTMPLWGNPGIALDTLAVSFLLPWLTVVIVAPLAKMEMNKGTVEKFREELRSLRDSYLGFMPRGAFAQSMLISAGTAAIVTPLAVGILYCAGITGFAGNDFVLYKSALATLLTFPVNPLVWLSALSK